MSDVSFTDFAYQAIEQAEQKRTHLMYLVIGCLLASLPGLAINGYFYQVAIHSKGGLSSGSLELIIILAMICLVLLAVGLQKAQSRNRVISRFFQGHHDAHLTVTCDV